MSKRGVAEGDVSAAAEALDQMQVAAEADGGDAPQDLAEGTVAPYSRSYGRTNISTILCAEDGGKSMVGKLVRIGGWVKTGRDAGAGAWCFLEVNDGSCFNNLQVIVNQEVAAEVGGLRQLTPTGTCVLIEGLLSETPEGTMQAVEVKGQKVLHVGKCDPATYPMAKKRQTMEFLREKMHLRARTNTIGAVARIRNALARATHLFFQEHGFLYMHSPLVTTSDCEGAGEMFQVTTLLSKVDEESKRPTVSAEDVEHLAVEVEKQGAVVKEAKAAAAGDKGNKELKSTADAEVAKLLALKKEQQEVTKRARYVGGLARLADGRVDYSEDFFSKPAFLTVSGQLQGEYYACGLTSIYTFGPTFRAEDSNTSRHLAEFWMIEPEIAFCDLTDCMKCAEDYVQFCCRHVLEHCKQDMAFINKLIDKGAIERVERVSRQEFKRLSYTEAIEILQEAVKSKKKKFVEKVEWGVDLASEHERYIAEEVFQQPVTVYDYPKDIKAFYMKLNPDDKTVRAMDVLVPKVGELIGGSQREDVYEVLKARMEQLGMDPAPYEGYLDIRKYGSVPHSGFGLGFERLIMFVTGISNIRDVIPFPRYPGNAMY
eukprot:evm.model.scf_3663.1 EVM.evm.TU.scf_3663.1   scf_3663:2252-10430(+)